MKAVGTISATGIMGTVSASKEDKKSSLSEVGLSGKVEGLLKENKIQKAHDLLEKYDIRHVKNKRSYTLDRQNGSDRKQDMVTAGWIAPKDKAKAYCTLVQIDGDRWLGTGNAEIQPGGVLNPNLREARHLADAMSLSWDNDEWTSPERTQDNLWLSGGTLNDINDGIILTEYDEYNRYGVCASVHPNTEGPVPPFWTNLQTDIIRRNNHPDIGIKFEYEHTFALHSASSISPSVAAGGLSISLPSGAGSWRIEETADPE